jgi:hypothetical protein
MFMCIRNNGVVMTSQLYNIYHRGKLKLVYNFLLNILITAAESFPNTSPTKQPKQDEEIENFDQDIFVKVFKGEDEDEDEDIFCDIDSEEDEWPDIILPEL